MNLPNSLSLFRIFLAAAFTAFMAFEQHWGYLAAFACFTLASVTDWLDGYLARKLNLVTDLGKLLDPLADKILVAAAFVCLTALSLCPAWVTVGILFREFTVTGLRLLLVEKGTVLPADGWGKWKTVTQMLYCFLALASLAFSGAEKLPAYLDVLLYLSLALTLFSGGNYVRKSGRLLV